MPLLVSKDTAGQSWLILAIGLLGTYSFPLMGFVINVKIHEEPKYVYAWRGSYSPYIESVAIVIEMVIRATHASLA
jgi:hypothetical protein